MDFDSDGLVLNALRLQLAAVKQHFIHVLILQARNDKDSAAEISKIDGVDLPCAMQLVDFIVSTKTQFDLCSNKVHLLQSLPNPGFSNAKIGMHERQLETELAEALSKVIFTPKSPTAIVHDLISQSLKPRTNYSNWLLAWSVKSEPVYVTRDSLDNEQTRWLDCLFANLMVMIDQTMIHSLVQWREGNDTHARRTWEVSGAAMMQATTITNHLAKRGLAANPKQAAATEFHTATHSTSADPTKALQSDSKLAAHCLEVGSVCAKALAGTEFEQVANSIATYFEVVVNWKDGKKLLNIPNPCRHFDLTRSLYLDSNAQPGSLATGNDN